MMNILIQKKKKNLKRTEMHKKMNDYANLLASVLLSEIHVSCWVSLPGMHVSWKLPSQTRAKRSLNTHLNHLHPHVHEDDISSCCCSSPNLALK